MTKYFPTCRLIETKIKAEKKRSTYVQSAERGIHGLEDDLDRGIRKVALELERGVAKEAGTCFRLIRVKENEV